MLMSRNFNALSLCTDESMPIISIRSGESGLEIEKHASESLSRRAVKVVFPAVTLNAQFDQI